MNDAIWMFEQRVLNRQQLLRRRKDYETDIAAIDAECEEPQIIPPDDFHSLWERATPQQRRALAWELIKRIDVHPEHIHIFFAPFAHKGWLREQTIPRVRYCRY